MQQSVKDAINEQIRLEFFAAHQYLAMSAWFDHENLPGFAGWLRAQWQEEIVHATKFFDFMVDRGEMPHLHSIGEPTHEFKDSSSVFEAALGHEQKVTKAIYELYELALTEKDYPLQMLLQWFITEQLEEEKTVGAVADRLKHVEGSRSAMLLIDNELAARKAGADAA
jgi:ferritin